MKTKIYLLSILAILLTTKSNAQYDYLKHMDASLKRYTIKSTICKQIDQPILIDGKLDEDTWKKASLLSDFQLSKSTPGSLAQHQTSAWVLYDDQFLYIGFECMEPEMEKVHAGARYHDDEDIRFDDRIEIFLDPNHNHQDIFHFVVNTNNMSLEQTFSKPIQFAKTFIPGELNWNTDWISKTQKLEGRWTGEIAIALDWISDETIQPGTTWGFNIARDRQAEEVVTFGFPTISVRNLKMV